MFSKKIFLILCLVIFMVGTAQCFAVENNQTSNSTEQEITHTFSAEELDQLTSPIALYPDVLIAQILPASTYPLEIVEASRWISANTKLKGKALENALVSKTWDPSVKALTDFPSVLQMMDKQLDWTQKLGDAFLSQSTDLMASIQKLRAKAHEAGNLKTSKEQTIVVQQDVIKIVPADPQVVYVPSYSPTVVYGSWWYPSYPPYAFYPYYPNGNIVSFGMGVAVGAVLWGDCDWGRGRVDIDINRYNNFNHIKNTNINSAKVRSWEHNPEHRKGVGYRDKSTQQRFGNTNSLQSKDREALRGRNSVSSVPSSKQIENQLKNKPTTQKVNNLQSRGSNVNKNNVGNRVNNRPQANKVANSMRGSAVDNVRDASGSRMDSLRGQESQRSSNNFDKMNRDINRGSNRMERGGGGGGRMERGGGGRRR